MKTKKEQDAERYQRNKALHVQRAIEWRNNNRERFNATRRKRRKARMRTDPEYRKKIQEQSKEQYRKHRARAILYSTKRKRSHQRLAVLAVKRAVYHGTLKRPNICDACKKTGQIQAHHPDYSKQLDVIWLCTLCHSDVHSLK